MKRQKRISLSNRRALTTIHSGKLFEFKTLTRRLKAIPAISVLYAILVRQKSA